MPGSVILAAARPETTPGVWTAPAWATHALIVSQLSVRPFNSTPLKREQSRPFPGAYASQPSQIHAGVGFQFELAGSGAANTPASWATWLRAAMFGAAVPAGASVGYPLTGAGDGAALSAILAMGPFAHEVRSLRGNIVFSFTEKQLPSASFDGLALHRTAGVLQTALDASGLVLPTPPAPVEVNLENTLIRLDGFTLGVREASFDLGMKTQLYSTTGERSIVFGKDQEGDRRSVKFRVVFELPDLATKNYAAAITAGQLLAFTVAHGTSAGNIIEIGTPAGTPTALIESFEIADVDNRTMATMAGVMVPSGAGNNELSLVTK